MQRQHKPLSKVRYEQYPIQPKRHFRERKNGLKSQSHYQYFEIEHLTLGSYQKRQAAYGNFTYYSAMKFSISDPVECSLLELSRISTAFHWIWTDTTWLVMVSVSFLPSLRTNATQPNTGLQNYQRSYCCPVGEKKRQRRGDG